MIRAFFLRLVARIVMSEKTASEVNRILAGDGHFPSIRSSYWRRRPGAALYWSSPGVRGLSLWRSASGISTWRRG